MSYSERSKTRRCFIVIAFQLYFRICHCEYPRKLERFVVEQNASACDLNSIEKNTEALLEANREVGLEVNTENQVHIMSCHQNAGQNLSLLIANKSFENVAK
jgi:hypothetical protein